MTRPLGNLAGRKAGRDTDDVKSKRGFAMTSKSWISWLGAGLIALALIVATPTPMVHAVGNAHKVSVVSFGLFGDQDVFRSEATGAAQVVAGRFGSGPIHVQYNSKKGGGATHAIQGGGHLGLLFGGLYSSSCEPRHAGNHGGRCRPSVVRLPGQSQMDLFRQRLFQCRTP